VTALDSMATYLPPGRVRLTDLADRLGLSPIQVRVFQRFHGLAEVRCDPNGSLLDLLLAAATRLDGLRGREHLVRYVLYARAIPVGVPYPLNPLHDLCEALGLTQAVAFTVTQQACASGLQALDAAGRLLAGEADPEALALVLAGEKTFTPESYLLPETSVFGEGSAACLVRHAGPRDRMLAYAVSQRGEFDGEQSDVAARFQKEYHTSLADAMLAALAEAGLALADLSVILPHNVNLVSWQRLCRRIGYPIDRVVLDNVPKLGHVFCADAFINYQTARDAGALRAGEPYLVAAAGAGRGATYSAMVFEH
jgi:3-oxoacyl-[acyl-carrier-protein] synthase III